MRSSNQQHSRDGANAQGSLAENNLVVVFKFFVAKQNAGREI
jgi:hypothetical protein